MEAQPASNVMTNRNRDLVTPASLRVAVVGIGWWSDVLADAAVRSDKVDIAACFTRSDDKRAAFAAKYGCRAAASYEDILTDRDIEAVMDAEQRPSCHYPHGGRGRRAGLPRQADRRHGR